MKPHFKDSDLPENHLSVERTEEIEKIAVPKIEKALYNYIKKNTYSEISKITSKG